MNKIRALILFTFAILTFFNLNLSFAQPATAKKYKTAVFAGGCFWCVEADFDKVKGVISTVSGYTGGSDKQPTYEKVSKGGTGHYEAVKITYDPAKVSYQQLLKVFWVNIDPTDPNGQFCDKGAQYRAAIFYQNNEQKKLAEASKQALERSGKFKNIYTKILPLKKFYPAENYHQNYYKKNPIRYRFYRKTCGRDKRLRQLWGE